MSEIRADVQHMSKFNKEHFSTFNSFRKEVEKSLSTCTNKLQSEFNVYKLKDKERVKWLNERMDEHQIEITRLSDKLNKVSTSSHKKNQ